MVGEKSLKKSFMVSGWFLGFPSMIYSIYDVYDICDICDIYDILETIFSLKVDLKCRNIYQKGVQNQYPSEIVVNDCFWWC